MTYFYSAQCLVILKVVCIVVDLKKRQSPTLYTRTGHESTAGVTMTYFYSAQCLVILKGCLHSGGLEKTSKSNVIYPHRPRVKGGSNNDLLL